MLLDSTNFQAHGHHRSRRRPRSPYPLANCPLLDLVNQRNCAVNLGGLQDDSVAQFIHQPDSYPITGVWNG